MGNGGDLSRILGERYKENAEKDNQVMQMLLNVNQGKPRKFNDDYNKDAIRKTLMTNGQEKCKHSKGELSISTSGYTEDVENFFDIIIKSMRQEDAEKDDCRLN